MNDNWSIKIGERTINVSGKTINQAVENWGRDHPNNRISQSGLLVQVRHKGITSYWSGKVFLHYLENGMKNVN